MIVDSGAREYVQAHFSAPPIFVFSHKGVIRCCQANRLKHQKPGEHTFYEATNELKHLIYKRGVVSVC